MLLVVESIEQAMRWEEQLAPLLPGAKRIGRGSGRHAARFPRYDLIVTTPRAVDKVGDLEPDEVGLFVVDAWARSELASALFSTQSAFANRLALVRGAPEEPTFRPVSRGFFATSEA